MNDQLPPVPYSEADYDYEDSNRSANPHFSDILRTRLSRRQILGGGLGLAVASGVFAPAGLSHAAAIAGKPAPQPKALAKALGFTAVPVGRDDAIVVPAGYVAEAILSWGEPISGSYPAYLDGGLNSGADQEQQIGMHHDGMHYFPLPGLRDEDGSKHGLLVMNHEYIDQNTCTRPARSPSAASATPTRCARKSPPTASAWSRSRKLGTRWVTRRGRYNRRITAATEMAITGPVRGHDKVRTQYSPDGTRTRGTINNCANGYTPWGTYLTCEENWAGYFVNRGEQPREQHALRRADHRRPLSRGRPSNRASTPLTAAAPPRTTTATNRTCSAGSSRSTRSTRPARR